MLIEITAGNVEDKKNYLRTLLQTFIDAKMNAYSRIEAQNSGRDEATSKYLASLWMIAFVTGVMQREEIAQRSGIPCGLLQGWESDKEFKALVKCNYRDFLICIVNLFT